MHYRILSQVVSRPAMLAVAAIAVTSFYSQAHGQSGAGYFTDSSTGIVYQKVTKTIERPVVETQVEQREQTVYRPQTVTETRPESRTIYTPVIEYKWEPRMHGRWNPFRQPTIVYHHIPKTHWEAQNEVVQRTSTQTQWVAEKRTVDVPRNIVRIQREQKVDFEPVGRVAPQASPPGATSAIASRLRPLNSSERVETFGRPNRFAASSSFSSPRIAASSVGRMTSDPPRRSTGQSGLRATELTPGPASYRAPALPPVSGGSGIATLPSPPIFR